MPARRLLLDTGPLVAYFDKRDSDHKASVEFFRAHQDAEFMTTWPVITEACHFIPASKRAHLLRLVAADMLRVIAILPGAMRIVVLLEKYGDRLPDLADVSLIYLAEAAGVSEVVTLDRADFDVYRISGRKRFDIVGP